MALHEAFGELLAAFMKNKLSIKPHVIPDKAAAESVARIFKRYKERAKKEGVRP